MSGGMLILINPNVRKSITFLNSASEYQWLTYVLTNIFVNFKYDIYLCIAYAPPASSKYSIYILESIENDILEYSKKGETVLCGDLNARTNSENDFYF